MNIVLAHGILGFDKIGNILYFNGVAKHLKEKFNAKVLTTKVNPTASIKDRSIELRDQIRSALGNPEQVPFFDPGEPTHIIGHSMGGLDSRLLLSPANTDQESKNVAAKISSLTTIGTPHQGSPIADIVYAKLNGTAPSITEAAFERAASNLLEQYGFTEEGIHDLTMEAMRQFNARYPDNPEVRYFCTAGTGRQGFLKTSVALFVTHQYLLHIHGERNDGVVLQSSAQHGTIIDDAWPADHLDEVGHDLDRPPSGKPENFNYLAKYDQIIEKIKTIPERP